MIVADDSTWQNYIEINPDARLLHGRTIGNYNDLSIIFGNDDVTEFSGNGVVIDSDWALDNYADAELANENQGDSSNEMRIIWTDAMDHCLIEKLLEQEKANPDVNLVRGKCIENFDQLHAIFGNNCEYESETSMDNTYDGGTQDLSQQTGAKPSSSSLSKQPSKRRRNEDTLVEMLSAISANIGRIADALTESSQPLCLDVVFDMVKNMPEFDDDFVIDVCEFLSLDVKRAKMFLKLNERLRRLW